MNKLLFLLLGITISTMAFSQNTPLKWINTPLIIDGDNSDWIERPSLFDANTGILYEARNDDKNLYLLFEVTDNKSQMKFMHAGFQVAFKVKTKPKLNATINILPQNIGGSMPEYEYINNTNNIQQEYLLKTSYAEIDGFLKTTGVINRDSSLNEKFTFNMGWIDNGHMLIELQIPLSEIFQSTDNFEQLATTPVSLKFTLKATEPPSMGGINAKGGMPQGGMSSGGGMPPGGGGPGGNPQKMNAMFSEQSFKIKILLSDKR